MGTHPIFESDFDCLTEAKSDMARTRAQATPRRSPRIKRIQNQRSQQLANSRSTADRNGNVSNREISRRNRRSGRLIDLSRSDQSGGAVNSMHPLNRRSTAAERLASRLDLSRQFYRGLVDRHQIESDESLNSDSQRQITNDAGTNVTISQLQTANANNSRQETDRDEFRLDHSPRTSRSNRRLGAPRMSLNIRRPSFNTNQPQVE